MLHRFWLILILVCYLKQWECIIVTFSPSQSRNFTVSLLLKIVDPVLHSISQGTIRQVMPPSTIGNRHYLAHMEAFSRTFLGLSVWLENGLNNSKNEDLLIYKYRKLTLLSLRAIMNKSSGSYIDWKMFPQSIVELAFLAQALLRSEQSIWMQLEPHEKHHILKCMEQYRRYYHVVNSNWLLFDTMIEAFLVKHHHSPNITKMEYNVQRYVKEFYAGDGTYGDGKPFHWDYYNSFVIHPILLDVLKIAKKHSTNKALFSSYYNIELMRLKRWADVQELLISPEGTMPVIGRSSTYRSGALQGLLLAVVMNNLSQKLQNNIGALRDAITNVLYNIFYTKPSFGKNGFLMEGFVGQQKKVIEHYISIGSLYLCTVGFIHLGVPANYPFWTAPGGAWSQRRIWRGDESVVADAAFP